MRPFKLHEKLGSVTAPLDQRLQHLMKINLPVGVWTYESATRWEWVTSVIKCALFVVLRIVWEECGLLCNTYSSRYLNFVSVQQRRLNESYHIAIGRQMDVQMSSADQEEVKTVRVSGTTMCYLLNVHKIFVSVRDITQYPNRELYKGNTTAVSTVPQICVMFEFITCS